MIASLPEVVTLLMHNRLFLLMDSVDHAGDEPPTCVSAPTSFHKFLDPTLITTACSTKSKFSLTRMTFIALVKKVLRARGLEEVQEKAAFQSIDKYSEKDY